VLTSQPNNFAEAESPMSPEDFDRLNWVERRALIAATLERETPALWDKIRAALQDACASFKKHYERAANGLQCELENGLRVLITRHDGVNDRERIVVAFDESRRTVDVTTNTGRMFFKIDCDRKGVFIHAYQDRNATYSPDELSRNILESFFFPKAKPKQ
jgi:hypothetical protein